MSAPVPPADCSRCERLAAFRETNALAHPDWHNAPVTSFGAETARLLIVGLAPGMKGANRTGRPFYGRFCRRSSLRRPAAPRFRQRTIQRRARRRASVGRLPDYQRGSLRAAAEQAGGRRDRRLPGLPRRRNHRHGAARNCPGAGSRRPRECAHRTRPTPRADPVSPRRRARSRWPDAGRQLSLLALQHPNEAPHPEMFYTVIAALRARLDQAA